MAKLNKQRVLNSLREKKAIYLTNRKKKQEEEYEEVLKWRDQALVKLQGYLDTLTRADTPEKLFALKYEPNLPMYFSLDIPRRHESDLSHQFDQQISLIELMDGEVIDVKLNDDIGRLLA